MKYYELVLDGDDSLLHIVDYELADFNLVRYWAGESLQSLDVTSLALTIGGKAADVVAGPLSILIASRKFVDTLSSIGVRFEGVKLDTFKDLREGVGTDLYLIQVNSVDCSRECPSEQGGRVLNNVRTIINDELVDDDLLLFRSSQLPGRIFLKERCAKALSSLIGFSLSPI